MRNLIFCVILFAGVSSANTLVGSFAVDYRYNAAGCQDSQPNAYNPYQCPSQILPGTIFFDNLPAGTYELVTTGLGPLGSPGAVIWTGDPSSATLSNTGYTWIFANSTSVGDTTTFTTTATESFAFFSHDWYPFDNDPGFSTTFSLYQDSQSASSAPEPNTRAFFLAAFGIVAIVSCARAKLRYRRTVGSLRNP
jgi:hypothetical protein